MKNDMVSTQIKLLRYAGLLGALAFAAAIIFVVVAVRGDPEKVADLSSDIIDVQEWHQPSGKRTLGIFILEDSSNSRYMRLLSMKIEDISKEIIEYWPDKYSEIIWFPQIPAVDKFGNEQDVLTVKMHFQIDDLKRMNWDNTDSLKLMNFAEVEKFGPLGREVAGAFCSDAHQVDQARRFCVQVLDLLQR